MLFMFAIQGGRMLFMFSIQDSRMLFMFAIQGGRMSLCLLYRMVSLQARVGDVDVDH